MVLPAAAPSRTRVIASPESFIENVRSIAGVTDPDSMIAQLVEIGSVLLRGQHRQGLAEERRKQCGGQSAFEAAEPSPAGLAADDHRKVPCSVRTRRRSRRRRLPPVSTITSYRTALFVKSFDGVVDDVFGAE